MPRTEDDNGDPNTKVTKGGVLNKDVYRVPDANALLHKDYRVGILRL